MAYTALKLINNAYYLSGIVARQLQTVSGQQVADGLDLLNDLLSIKTANNRLIPYYQLLTISEVIGQEGYFIPNLIGTSSVTFNIGTVRYAMYPQGRKDYFGQPRVDGIQSLSFSYHVERGLGGATIYVYFLPAAAYPLNIVGKFGLSQVANTGVDLSLTYDRFYIAYLKYALAEYICEDNNIAFQEGSAQKLREYEGMITDISPYDFTMQKISTLQAQGGYTWAQVNLGGGWTPI